MGVARAHFFKGFVFLVSVPSLVRFFTVLSSTQFLRSNIYLFLVLIFVLLTIQFLV